MAEWWNCQQMAEPVTCSFSYSQDEQEESRDMFITVYQGLQGLLELTQIERSLDTERFVLARLIYKQNNQFRLDRRLWDMKKLDKALKRYRCLTIVDYSERLIDMFGNGIHSLIQGCSFGAIFAPSRQMIEYVLSRCVGALSILKYISGMCMEVYLHVRQQLQLGQFYMQMTVLAANISRIWLLSRDISLRLTRFYRQLIPLVQKMKASQQQWIPSGSELPTDIDHLQIVIDSDCDIEISNLESNAKTGQDSKMRNPIQDNKMELEKDMHLFGGGDGLDLDVVGTVVERDVMKQGLSSTQDLGIKIERQPDLLHNKQVSVLTSKVSVLGDGCKDKKKSKKKRKKSEGYEVLEDIAKKKKKKNGSEQHKAWDNLDSMGTSGLAEKKKKEDVSSMKKKASMNNKKIMKLNDKSTRQTLRNADSINFIPISTDSSNLNTTKKKTAKQKAKKAKKFKEIMGNKQMNNVGNSNKNVQNKKLKSGKLKAKEKTIKTKKSKKKRKSM